MKCKFIKTDGSNCSANAMSGSDYCYYHNPKISPEEKKESQAKGGRANVITVQEPMLPISISEPKHVVTLLTDTINDVRAGILDVKIANCIGVLSGQLIKAMDMADISQRVEKIEKVIFEKHTYGT